MNKRINPDEAKERRGEQRLNYNWPIWFSKEHEKRLADVKYFQGQMVNISSAGVMFRCEAKEDDLHVGQQIIMKFRVPRFGSFEPFNVLLTTRHGRICRVRDINNSCFHVTIKFDSRLFFKPGEQGLTESEARQKLEGAEI